MAYRQYLLEYRDDPKWYLRDGQNDGDRITPTRYNLKAPGARSLVDTCIRVLAMNMHRVPDDHLTCIPASLLPRLWRIVRLV